MNTSTEHSEFTTPSAVTDGRALVRLGFPYAAVTGTHAVYISSQEQAALLWSDVGWLLAVGAPATLLSSMPTTPSVMGAVGPDNTAQRAWAIVVGGETSTTRPTAPMQAQVEPTTPHESALHAAPPAPDILPAQDQTPLAWLSRIMAPDALRAWVLETGLSGPHAAAWALLANAMGWELPLPDASEIAGAP
jgi:hypothetical protein